jgi:hypothetical protein
MARHFSKSDGIVERRIHDEHILVPIRKDVADLNSLYTLNEVASFIWQRAIEGLEEPDIVARLRDAFDVDPAKAASDTTRILDELVALGALILVPTGK